MKFEIRAYPDSDELLHPFELGEIVLRDETTGSRSGPVPEGKRYMVFVELLFVHSFLESLVRNKARESYMVSSGEKVVANRTERTATFRFVGLTMTIEAQKALAAIRVAMEYSLRMLAGYEDQDHAVIADFRDALARTEVASF